MPHKKSCKTYCDFVMNFDNTIRRFRIVAKYGYFGLKVGHYSDETCKILRWSKPMSILYAT